MNKRIKDQYNSLYSAQENVFGEGKPLEVVQRLSDYLAGGTVLDIGGGEGRNALYLAQQGFSVLVLDISEVGIEKLKKAAKKTGLNIDTHVTDVVGESIEGMYDSCILSFVMHHMSEVDATNLISEAQQHTSENGVHIVSTFMNTGDLYERNKKSGRFYPSKELMKELYGDWNIQELTSQEIMTHARNKDGQRMKNYTLTLIAIKKK